MLAASQFVEGGLRDVDMPTIDELAHLPKKECEIQRADVRSVHIRVCHDDNAVISELVRIKLVFTNAATERRHEISDLSGAQHLVETGLLHIQNLAFERQNGLEFSIAALLSRATCRVSLHQIQLAQRRITLLAVRQFPGKAGDIERAFAAGHFSRLARRLSGSRSIDHFSDHQLGIDGVFNQEVTEELVHRLLNRTLHFTGHQFVFRLRGEFGVGHLHRQDGHETFSRIITGGGDLVFLRKPFFFNIII